MRIAILAYGSLIDDPGDEIRQATTETRGGVRTPFRVEFARLSKKWGDGPTLVPVDQGGAYVEAKLLVLREGVSIEEATRMLYQRESGKNKPYKPDPAKENQIWIERLPDKFGLDVVLYTRIKAKIMSAETLADKAIESAKGPHSDKEKNGIYYLLRAMENGIRTPSSDEYEREILEKTGTGSLKKALEKIYKS